MIDLNKIRSLKTLETIKNELNEFISTPHILEAYIKDFNWGEEDYEADLEAVKVLLKKVEQRAKSLTTFLKKSNPTSVEETTSTIEDVI